MPGTSEYRNLMRLVRFVAGLGVVLVLVVAVIAILYAGSVRSEARARDVSACVRGNLVRGYLIGRAAQLPPTPLGDVAPVIFPLLVCSEDGNFSRMTSGEAAKFIALLNRGREPIVVDGIVTDSKPLPLP